MKQMLRPKHILNYTLVGVNLLMALVFCLALFSFNVNDGGWSANYAAQVGNILGQFGAFLSDFLFSILGISSYLIPFTLILLASYALYAGLFSINYPKMFYVNILLGAISLLIGIALLSGIYSNQSNSIMPYTNAGIIGINLAYFSRSILGTGISILLGLVLILAGSSLLFKFSWLTLMDNLGAFLGGFIFKDHTKPMHDDFIELEEIEEKVFDRTEEFSQPLFNNNGELIKDTAPVLDMRDAEDFINEKASSEKDDIAKLLDNNKSISTFTTNVNIDDVMPLDIDATELAQVQKRMDEAVGFDFASYSKPEFTENLNQDLQARLDDFDKNYEAVEEDDDVDFTFPDDFFNTQKDELEQTKLQSKDTLTIEDFEKELLDKDFSEEREVSSLENSFNDIYEPELDEVMYVADEIKYQPENRGVFMEKKSMPDFDNMSEEEKKAITQPREYGYLNKSIPKTEEMQKSADKLYRAIMEPREHGYIDEPVESLEKVQKDADNLYRAVSQPREYGYIDEPVAQLDKIQKIADELYKAVSEPREYGFLDAPVEQLSKLQNKIDDLYRATTQPREHGFLEETVPQIAQLQAYADELYRAIAQPREHGFLEETIPQLQMLQQDIDKLYLAVTQPREYGFIEEPVESLEKIQKETDEVINTIGVAGKKLDAVNGTEANTNAYDIKHAEVDARHLPLNSIANTFENLDNGGEVNPTNPSESEFINYPPNVEPQTPSQVLTDSLEPQTPSQVLTDSLEPQTSSQVLTDSLEPQTPSQVLTDSLEPQTPSQVLTDSADTQSQDTNQSNSGKKIWRVSDFQTNDKLDGSTLGSGELPNLDILEEIPEEIENFTAEEQDALIYTLKQSLEEFGVSSEVVEVLPGPVVTRFEIELAPGVKSSKVSALDKDIARAIKVPSVMVVEVTPGKSTVGIEIPNQNRSTISLRKQLSSDEFINTTYDLPLALGEDVSGKAVVANLAKMPHLLVAGTTGSGKSVGINAMLLSLLVKLKPEELRLILIDPKMLELSVYQGIPHLLAPVVTDMKQAANALQWCVSEMEHRYKLMAAMGVKNIQGYNKRMSEAEAVGASVINPLDENLYLEKMPYIVVIIDEFNDLLIAVGKKVEELIARLAQKARASGIHLILATQRPSVDVITGVIKANIPARIGFQVSTKIDSRTILDTSGAEQLLGNGDMLYLSGNDPMPQRVHGAYVSDDEVYRIAEDWRRRSGEPNYIEDVLTGGINANKSTSLNNDLDYEEDELYDEVVEFVLETGRPSASAIQRRFSIGFPRAARLIDTMEANGLISALQNNGKREILVKPRA